MIDIKKYDLTEPKHVLELGKEVGEQFLELIPLIHELSDDMKLVFFCAVLGTHIGVMGASIGMQESRLIVEILLKSVQQKADEQLASSH